MGQKPSFPPLLNTKRVLNGYELQPLKSVYCLTVVKLETYATHSWFFFFFKLHYQYLLSQFSGRGQY